MDHITLRRELEEAIDRFVRGESDECPSLEKANEEIAELKAVLKFDRESLQFDRERVRVLEKENADLKEMAQVRVQRIKDLKTWSDECWECSENKAENVRLQIRLDRMTARYIDESNRTTNGAILPDCPISDGARKVIENLK